MPRAVVIYNPISGGSRGESASVRVRECLEAVGYDVERRPTRDRSGAKPIAREVASDVDHVIVVGGDGTVREAIEGLGDARTRVPIGIVPTGNANVVAMELGIPRDTEGAIDTAVDGTPVAMDVGVVRTDAFEELFLAVVGVGWDAHTVRLLDRFRHTPLGRAGYRVWADGLYAVAGLGAALRPAQERFRIRVDGEEMAASYVAAYLCNLRTYGKNMAMTPEARRDSGTIHVHGRKRASLPFVLWHLGAAAGGRHAPAFVSDYAEGRMVRLDASRKLAVQVDGDDRGWASWVEASILPGAVRIMAPHRVSRSP